ncbi:hypothetical protein MesoLjLc_03690 [Mesorhizobium sp. L-8-10]|uniref:hypothetical protein n=1 Tax=unclassified Mesorhizobium TaxID=325217 RepID=UPI0019291836|nr:MULTISPECIES: hypothetical protein [unclassified Mesorhizobium]BCH20592.1 hypothetical protein MesoLjLb_03770 [Mesorhizobium sp. L-8-3]BCH28439.1 hypothetical protein MesoLjLc_03690 [Mesorhizobium sp. L-8-10]
MHDDHHHHHDDGHSGYDHHHPHPPGHNGPAGKAVQWQTPHLPHDHSAPQPREADLDLVEKAFVEAFSGASDIPSLLRLSGIPFVGETADGTQLHLLRVETEDLADVGAVMPLIGGNGVRYDPLPQRLASRRRKLAFVYHDGQAAHRLGFAEARSLSDRTQASQITMAGQ